MKDRSSILEEEFDYTSITTTGSYKGIQFEKLIFCEGAQIRKNPFFSYLPFGLNKGQLLTIQSDQLPTNTTLKKKVFILPYERDLFKVGATYSWKWENDSPEPEKTKELKSYLEEITHAKYQLIKEEAGIRPSVKDRRPLIGSHPTIANYYVFNGMGSKGCLMAPLLIKEFIDHLQNETPLHKEVSVRRYDKLFDS